MGGMLFPNPKKVKIGPKSFILHSMDMLITVMHIDF